MPKKSSKKNQPKPNVETNRSQDFFQSLLENQIYSSPSGSSSNPNQNMGFSSYASPSLPFQQQFNQPFPQPSFSNYQYSQPFQQTFRQPIFQQTPTRIPAQIPSESEDEGDDDEPEDEEVEEVEETQPEEVVESDPKGKKVKNTKMPWSEAESKLLAMIWSQVSENMGKGTNQTKESFWRTIRDRYNSHVEQKRRADQITGKWSKMAKDVKIFIGCYTKLAQYWQSGANEADIISHSRRAFKETTKRNFIYEESWKVLKDCPKFLAYEGVVSRRRPRIEEPMGPPDSNPNVNTGADPSQFESLFREEPLRRPPGRASAKSQRSSGSSDAASHLSSEEARLAVIETANATKRTMEKIYNDTDERTILDNLTFLTTSVAPDLPPEQLELIMKAKRKIHKRYQHRFDSDEE